MCAVSVSAESAPVKGDFNKDGVVDFSDVKQLLSTSALMKIDGDLISNPDKYSKTYKDRFGFSDEEYNALDLNGDGIVKSTDGGILLKYIISSELGYDGELTAKDVLSFYDGLSAADKEKGEEYINKCNAEWEKKNPSEAAEDKKSICDVNGDNVLDQTDLDLIDKYDIGDANNDGKIDSKDASIILKNYADSLVSASNGTYVGFFGDLNGDGVVDSKDATIVLVKAANDILNG